MVGLILFFTCGLTLSHTSATELLHLASDLPTHSPHSFLNTCQPPRANLLSSLPTSLRTFRSVRRSRCRLFSVVRRNTPPTWLDMRHIEAHHAAVIVCFSLWPRRRRRIRRLRALGQKILGPSDGLAASCDQTCWFMRRIL
jgi:hypothetical protein